MYSCGEAVSPSKVLCLLLEFGLSHVSFGYVGRVMVKYRHQVGGDGVEVVEEGSPLTVTAYKKMSEFLFMVCISFAA